MSFDQDIMDELRATFFDECSEYLLRNEELLASLRGGMGGAEERETLDAIFRIAHSIKAGAAAFGLPLLADLTHHLEAVLDRLRTGRLALDEVLLGLLLQSGDALAAQVDAARSGIGGNAGSVHAMIERLSGIAMQEPAVPPMPSLSAPRTVPAGVLRRWAIRFRPIAYSGGNEPMLIIRALARLGRLVSTLDLTQLPDIEQFDPTEPVLAWRIELETIHPEADIREIFEFVEDEADILIEQVEGVERAAAPAADPLPVPAEPPQRALADFPAPPAPQSPVHEAAQGSGKGSIRVDLDRVDRLVDLVGELIITEAALAQVCQELDPRAQRRLAAVVKGLGLHSRNVQDAVMAIRMQPVKSIFARMPRMVRDLATRLGKNVEIATVGEMTEVDKTIIEELADPLTHMIRNALDHGIEPPADRIAAGKPPCGTITLSAENKGGRIIIRVEDDGRGIDRARVLARARSLGLVPPDAAPSSEEVDALLFAPGFSTSDTVTDVSGRGVGMDVVQRNIQRLGGRVTVQSEPGRGTGWTMSLPLTLAVLDGMLVRTGGELYVIPLANILDSTRPKPADVREVVGHGTMVYLRGDWLPLLRLGDLFNLPTARRAPSQGIVVRVETDTAGTIGLLVDELLGQQQVVVKPFEQNFTHVRGIAATTILGNGRVCLILDLDDCVALSRAAACDPRDTPCAAGRAAE
ncbi:chemotaxis protein CheA [Azospirillum picis]|uniref:Chemotaxis protein CheA n=1 Tax=Azospirillum picis TaxID=488438 RepID=A0ABU0MW42_9PROT|nr:chemotaxis protein CheA [Azospirillum picis]MBP2303505.1 two-component system chemotaxis sensor kinase CheA [Azospirillum picis]MDQ0537408.1 two-component system chemotaxis sensor kinase CheA [Azospirillum picis]